MRQSKAEHTRHTILQMLTVDPIYTRGIITAKMVLWWPALPLCVKKTVFACLVWPSMCGVLLTMKVICWTCPSSRMTVWLGLWASCFCCGLLHLWSLDMSFEIVLWMRRTELLHPAKYQNLKRVEVKLLQAGILSSPIMGTAINPGSTGTSVDSYVDFSHVVESSWKSMHLGGLVSPQCRYSSWLTDELCYAKQHQWES